MKLYTNKMNFINKVVNIPNFFCLIYLLITNTVFSQTNLNKIHTTSDLLQDTGKINLLTKLSSNYSNIIPDSSLYYAQLSLELSKKINYPKGINNSLRQIGIYYLNTSEYDTALLYFKKALFVALSCNDIIRLGPSYENIGTCFTYKGEVDSALHYMNLALDRYSILNDYKGMGTACLWIGNIFKIKGEYISALKFYYSALDHFEMSNDTSSNSYVYINLSSIYRLNGQYDQALNNAIKALNLNIKSNDLRGEAVSRYRLSLIYVAMDDCDNAVVELSKALDLFINLNDQNFIAICADQLGYCNLIQCNFDDAIKYFEKALEIAISVGDKNLEYSATGHLGSLYRGRGEYVKAMNCLQSAYSMATLLEDDLSKSELLGEMILTYNEIGKTDSVRILLFLKDSLDDELYTKENQRILAEMQTKYETEKKEQENTNLRLQNQLQVNENLLLSKQFQIGQLVLKEEQAQRTLIENVAQKRLDSIDWLTAQQNIERKLNEQNQFLSEAKLQLNLKQIQNRNLTIGILSGLAVLGGFITYLLIRARKRKFDHTLKEVTEKALRAQLKPHFVFNALASIQRYVHENPTMAENYLTKFSHFTQEVLMNSEKPKIPLSDELAMLSKYIELHSLRLKQPIAYEFQMAKSLDPEDVFVPPAIFQPLVENSINHNFSAREGQGKILLTCKNESNQLICTLEDSCSGTRKQIEVQQTRNQDRKSFGLEIVRERLELWSKGKGNKGYLELIPQNEGMRVILGIPL